jgi:hypothetical protein
VDRRWAITTAVAVGSSLKLSRNGPNLLAQV